MLCFCFFLQNDLFLQPSPNRKVSTVRIAEVFIEITRHYLFSILSWRRDVFCKQVLGDFKTKNVTFASDFEF